MDEDIILPLGHGLEELCGKLPDEAVGFDEQPEPTAEPGEFDTQPEPMISWMIWECFFLTSGFGFGTPLLQFAFVFCWKWLLVKWKANFSDWVTLHTVTSTSKALAKH